MLRSTEDRSSIGLIWRNCDRTSLLLTITTGKLKATPVLLPSFILYLLKPPRATLPATLKF
ncbi:MAG: hypothetical protein RMZ95_032095 [Nostoc sp. DedQUE07]